MPFIPHPALALILPVAGMIMSVIVFYMPMWHCRLESEFKVHLVYEFRRCGGSGNNIDFIQQNGTPRWTPLFNGRKFQSDSELAREARHRSRAVEVLAPAVMPVEDLYRVLRELERAGLEVAVLSSP
jgi:hypothetical protein